MGADARECEEIAADAVGRQEVGRVPKGVEASVTPGQLLVALCFGSGVRPALSARDVLVVVLLVDCRDRRRCIDDGNVEVAGTPEQPVIDPGSADSERWNPTEEALGKDEVVRRLLWAPATGVADHPAHRDGAISAEVERLVHMQIPAPTDDQKTLHALLHASDRWYKISEQDHVSIDEADQGRVRGSLGLPQNIVEQRCAEIADCYDWKVLRTCFSSRLGDAVTASQNEDLHLGRQMQPTVECVLLNDAGMPPKRLRDGDCLLYTSPSPRDGLLSRMPS